jgi:hypothetical protein
MMDDDVPGPNGLAFSPDEKKLYVVASRAEPHRNILAYDVVDNGTSSANGAVLIDAGPGGSPDGFRSMSTATCGAAGAWAATSSTACACSPRRQADRHITLPERCANVCFGGPLPQPAVHGGQPLALRALRQHAGRARRLNLPMHSVDSRYAWWRLAASVALSTFGAVGMWGVVVIFPTCRTEFAATRADGVVLLHHHHAGLRRGLDPARPADRRPWRVRHHAAGDALIAGGYALAGAGAELCGCSRRSRAC